MQKQPTYFDDLINSAEARRISGDVSLMTLWRWEKAGVIPPPLKIRARNYWRRGEFVRALEGAAVVAGVRPQ